ncbi:protein FAM166B [Arapaima gigas]
MSHELDSMEEFPQKFSKVLVTPDPHYIPGYAGYCPQLKYHHGQTYGKLTAQLLSSPGASVSRRLVLQPARSSLSGADSDEEEICTSLHGDGRYSGRMIPGYTGNDVVLFVFSFVPKSQNYFSHSYAETCRRALSEFYRERRKRENMTGLVAQSSVENKTAPEFKTLRHHTPPNAFYKEPTMYKSLDPWKPLGSPYLMEDSNPDKYFISGFTGYVPKSRFLIGMGYPVTTNKALIQFNSEKRSRNSNTQFPRKNESFLPPVVNIYSTKKGLLPSYTGHVPGYKFRYGHTFGQLTQNSLDLQRQADD